MSDNNESAMDWDTLSKLLTLPPDDINKQQTKSMTNNSNALAIRSMQHMNKQIAEEEDPYNTPPGDMIELRLYDVLSSKTKPELIKVIRTMVRSYGKNNNDNIMKYLIEACDGKVINNKFYFPQR